MFSFLVIVEVVDSTFLSASWFKTIVRIPLLIEQSGIPYKFVRLIFV